MASPSVCMCQLQNILEMWHKTLSLGKFNYHGCQFIHPSGFITAVAVFRKPNAIPLCFSIDLFLNFLLSWLLVLLPSTFFLDVLFFFSPVVPIPYTYVYSLNFADDQVLLAQDHHDMEYMARKLKEEYEKWGLAINLEIN